jgi:hypothetical protein
MDEKENESAVEGEKCRFIRKTIRESYEVRN